ncbi:hypothetical protein F11_03615 [Rhodospirillum rubrum F11]|nr:hypothetical protein F11_03615 [Rhodospirillum rubrum F11]
MEGIPFSRDDRLFEPLCKAVLMRHGIQDMGEGVNAPRSWRGRLKQKGRPPGTTL